MSFLAVLAIALAPGFAIALLIYLKDEHEREPIPLLLGCFLLGVASVLVTLILSSLLSLFVEEPDNTVTGMFVKAFIWVALVEEYSKYIFVRYVAYPNKNFNEPYDAIVYAVMVSMGFATLENIMYVMDSGIATGILRMFTAVPAHATFAIIMGYFMGLAKFKYHRPTLGIFGLAGATLLHGAYDYFLFISFIPGMWIGAFVSLAIGIILSSKAIRLHQEVSPFKK